MTVNVKKYSVFLCISMLFIISVKTNSIKSSENLSHKYSLNNLGERLSNIHSITPKNIEISSSLREQGDVQDEGERNYVSSDTSPFISDDIAGYDGSTYPQTPRADRMKRSLDKFVNSPKENERILQSEEFDELVIGRVGEQQIRHGRSRSRFTRMGREKKNNPMSTLYHNEQFANGNPFEDVIDGRLTFESPNISESKHEDLQYSPTEENIIFTSTPSIIPTVPNAIQTQTDMKDNNNYDLRSFFGITFEPERTEKFSELITTEKEMSSSMSYEEISYKKLQSIENKIYAFPSDITTFIPEKPITQTSNINEYGEMIVGSDVPNQGSVNEKRPPKSSLENVHTFINYKNRSKKKDDAKAEVETETPKPINIEEEIDNIVYPDEEPVGEIMEDGTVKIQRHADIVTKFLRIVESQHLVGENCTAGTDLNLGEGVVDRYAQERFRVEADVAVNRANMLTRLWKYAGPEVMHSEYLLHASVFSMVEFDDDIFAAGNCYDQYQYKDYQLFCPFAYRLPEGPILVKDLAVEYKYLSNTSEWFYIARKNAENVVRNWNQFSRGYNTYTYNESAHTDRVADEILSVTYEDGKWSKPYFDCGGGNIWMLTYTVPFFGFANNTYFFKGTSGIDIDLRRVDIDQCPLQSGSTQLNIFAATDKCKKRTTECVSLPGLGFRRGSYKCVCKRGFYFPEVTADHRFYNGTVLEEEYEKLMESKENRYSNVGSFECLMCAEGCEACVDNSPCVVTLNWLMRTAILVLDCIVICCLPFVVFFTWKYGNVKVVRAASPVLLRVIALGALFIYCTNIVMYPRPTIYTCTARVWLREIGFCLTYGALMLKTWRISVIFRVRSAKAIKITDFNLLKRLGVILAVFGVFLVIRTLVAPPIVIVGRTATDLKAYLCKTDWWDHSFTMMEVMFLIWGIRLCIVVRKAPSEFNESKFISMAIYNEFLLSIFLNISMLFLQSPANPDLLYIIFFCHTQLTITLLLCFIFGSKAYMVFKGHGKSDHESSSMVAKTPAGKFINKSRSGVNSQYATSTNSSTGHGEYSRVSEQDIQEEFRRLYAQLEILKDKNVRFGNRHLTAKISAMQEAATRHDTLEKTLKEEAEPEDDKKKKTKDSKFSILSGMDKSSQSQTSISETANGNKEYTIEVCESTVHPVKSKKLNVTFSPMKNGGGHDNIKSSECDNSKKKHVDDISTSSKSPKERQKTKSASSPDKNTKDDTSIGCDTCVSSIDNEQGGKINDKPMDQSESDPSSASKAGTTSEGENGSPNHTPGKSNKNQIKSGHARTHAIVINLDDKSRFTEEVTV